jgi:hypothetical protein
MSDSSVIAESRNTFGSIDRIAKSLINHHVEATLISGARFWGKLEEVDDIWLVIKGYKNQPILLKKSKLAALVEAV